MSQQLAKLMAHHKGKKLNRQAILGLASPPVYDDGRTKQAYKDECDIVKIMARADISGTITHLAKHEGTFSDYSDYDFFAETQKLTRGREVFDELPAEIRREFNQSPAEFFAHVNNPENRKLKDYGLPALAKPGTQRATVKPLDADQTAAAVAKQSLDVKPEATAPTPSAPPQDA